MRLIPLLSIVIPLLLPPAVLAVTVPTFPSCAGPQGEVKVSYKAGTHGIVGSTALYTGSDTVYRLSDGAVTQCFCAENGAGIQTDWWKADHLGGDDIRILVSQGWIHVPAGELWGLSNGPYLARNTSYSCLPAGQGNSSGSVLGTSESGGTGGGEEGEVLGLAATGDSLFVYSTFALAILLLAIGFRRLRKNLV